MDARTTPLHDHEIERMLCSIAMQSREAFTDACEIIPNEDRFHNASCNAIWASLRHLNAKGDPWSVQALSAVISETRRLPDVGGWVGLTETYSLAPITAGVEYYARKVHELWLVRSLLAFGIQVQRDALDRGATTAEELLAKAERAIFALSETGVSVGAISSKELAILVADKLDRIEKGERGGLPLGFTDIDRIFVGMAPKSVTILAGRPGGGKTKLAINTAMHLSDLGIRGVFYSLEMSNLELGLRMAYAISGVDSQMHHAGKLTDEQWKLLHNACHTIAQMNISWQDKPGLKVSELISSLRKLKRTQAIEYAVIDHILLMRPDHHQAGRSRNDDVGEVSRMVKLAAKEVDIPILALCQMNRGIEGRNDAPRLSDLRDSGNLEQDADNVIFLHKPKDELGNMVDIYIAKQRNGPTGKCSLVDRKGVFRFENMATRYLS